MFNITTFNKISNEGLKNFDGNKYSITPEDISAADGVVLRSFKMHDTELPDSLKAIARAGAGTNNVPVEKCSDKGIVVFNAPGANANGVKEMTFNFFKKGKRGN
jgi:D-3-phosphoglycerate dehydrogenase